MSEISRASKQSAPTHTSRQSAPSHVSRQSARLRQEPPEFKERDLPQQTRRRHPHTAGEVPLPTSLANMDGAGGAQAFQPLITSTEPVRSQSGLLPSASHVASSLPPKVIPMRQVRGDYYILPDSRFDAVNASTRRSDPGAAQAKASVRPRAIASDGVKDAPANIASFEGNVREGRRTPALPSQVMTPVERYVESFRGHAARGDLADPNISFDQTMNAVQQHPALPRQDDESNLQYARPIRAMERSHTEMPADIIRPASLISTATASWSLGRTARSSALLRAWYQDVFERGVLQMIYDQHMLVYNTTTVPKQDVVLEIKNGYTMGCIPSKPTIQVRIPDLDDVSCAPFLERYPSPTREIEECKDEPRLEYTDPVVPVAPVVQTQKELETILEHKMKKREPAAEAACAKHNDVAPLDNREVDEVHIDVQTLMPEKPPAPLSDVFGRHDIFEQCGALVEDDVEIPVLKGIKTQVPKPVQGPRHTSIHILAGKETASPRKTNMSEGAPRRQPLPPPPDPDPSDGGTEGSDGEGADPEQGSVNPDCDMPGPGGGIPPLRAGNGEDDGDGQSDHSTVTYLLSSERNRLLHFFEPDKPVTIEHGYVKVKQSMPTLLEKEELQEIAQQYSASIQPKKKLEGLVVPTEPRPSQSIPRKYAMSDKKGRDGASAEGERYAHLKEKPRNQQSPPRVFNQGWEDRALLFGETESDESSESTPPGLSQHLPVLLGPEDGITIEDVEEIVNRAMAMDIADLQTKIYRVKRDILEWPASGRALYRWHKVLMHRKDPGDKAQQAKTEDGRMWWWQTLRLHSRIWGCVRKCAPRTIVHRVGIASLGQDLHR
ncbi:hypothetical protein BDZ89DRAFT_1167636 [Hymenopellis radicata]|nr:hypothetical protein BDZ89DRAFT_1167636 [Hymenopellis radicata]